MKNLSRARIYNTSDSDAAHRFIPLGAGLLESTYQTCLHYEFSVTGPQFEHQVRLPVIYNGIQLETGYRIDWLKIASSSGTKQWKNCCRCIRRFCLYLKLSGWRVGLLINFNVPICDTASDVVNGYPDDHGRIYPQCPQRPRGKRVTDDKANASNHPTRQTHTQPTYCGISRSASTASCRCRARSPRRASERARNRPVAPRPPDPCARRRPAPARSRR